MNFSGILGWSADSRVRAFLAPDDVRADKAVRAPIAAFVRSALLAAVVLTWLVWSATPLSGEASEARYRVIKIIEGSGTTIPEAGGINQKGQVVGSIETSGHPQFWLWSNGVREDLLIGNGKAGNAVALNNQGQVVGSFYTGESFIDFWGDLHAVYHAFVWDNGSLQDLGTLGGWDSSAAWINDRGVAVGAALRQVYFQQHVSVGVDLRYYGGWYAAHPHGLFRCQGRCRQRHGKPQFRNGQRLSSDSRY